MKRTTTKRQQLRRKYRWQKRLLLTVFAGIVILLASLLNLAAVAVVQHYENKPTVYEVKYTFNDEGSVDRLERLISES